MEGAWSHQAARTLFGDAPITFVPEFPQVFQQVDQVPGAYGVVPVENSAAGSVVAVYDLILQYRFFIVGAVDVKVAHLFPAHAGVIPLFPEPAPPYSTLPRACGGDPATKQTNANRIRSSPRMRG